ncbi:uncharacterized protein C8R40DRAFT_1218908 [Lentinula edodes]|uniref:uncharacterized protein n=1 Tax=Lentinula edodes TaxID=5353 RepID=UPI001E8E2116|nr:uncharacterized protein C8R40DRAFT_1218908 [Lentinula edodes]KAH7878544.1 hypothetical protein C8R40DRAFT_1218908 [Lentinula edodes]
MPIGEDDVMFEESWISPTIVVDDGAINIHATHLNNIASNIVTNATKLQCPTCFSFFPERDFGGCIGAPVSEFPLLIGQSGTNPWKRKRTETQTAHKTALAACHACLDNLEEEGATWGRCDSPKCWSRREDAFTMKPTSDGDFSEDDHIDSFFRGSMFRPTMPFDPSRVQLEGKRTLGLVCPKCSPEGGLDCSHKWICDICAFWNKHPLVWECPGCLDDYCDECEEEKNDPCEIIICTPGEMINLLTVNSVHATNLKRMDGLSEKILQKPLEITIERWLLEILGQMYNESPECCTLVFVDRQEAAHNLLRELIRQGYLYTLLHGGKDQVNCDSTIPHFKAGVVTIVIAPSVAARGLDPKQLKLVVNYHAPNHLEDYVHCAGCIGRGGNKGMCVTFITPEQERYSVNIYCVLKAGFLDKLRTGKAQAAGSGFDGKGVDRLNNKRDAKQKAERKAYGVPEEEEPAVMEEAAPGGTTANAAVGQYDFRKPQTPDSSKGLLGLASTATAAHKLAYAKEEQKIQDQICAAEEAAASTGKGSTAHKQAFSVVANSTQGVQVGLAIAKLIDMTGGFIRNNRIYYHRGKKLPLDSLPKLRLVVKSNQEYRASAAALQAEMYEVTFCDINNQQTIASTIKYLISCSTNYELMHADVDCN